MHLTPAAQPRPPVADDEASRRGSSTESRLQRLRWVAQTIAEHGGHKYNRAAESCPLLHALDTTKKQLDSLDADMATLDSELERARLCLQACPVSHARLNVSITAFKDTEAAL